MGWHSGSGGYGYKPYVSVAQRRANAEKELKTLFKNGKKANPVRIEGRKVATTFWGQAWCTNLENYSDYANRLPRGLSYVRNGSVVHLEIGPGQVEALVSGSELYKVKIEISPLAKERWRSFKARSAGQIGTLVELLQGKLSKGIMELVTGPDHGLFPRPKEIRMRCSCPDSAGLCKHLAAVMYGVGNRLDLQPELLFELRGVDQLELIEQAVPAQLGSRVAVAGESSLDGADLGALFGIELGDVVQAIVPSAPASRLHVNPRIKPVAKASAASRSARTAKVLTPKVKKTIAKTTRAKPAITRAAPEAKPVKTSPESTQTMAKVVKRLTPSVVAASTKEAKAKPKLSKAKKAPKNSAARARVAKKP